MFKPPILPDLAFEIDKKYLGRDFDPKKKEFHKL
jgi:hypothetical protein